MDYLQNAKRLTENEEQELLNVYYIQQDHTVEEKLVQQHIRLVMYISKKYWFPNANMDELISAGTLGLLKGIRAFNIERGTKLNTYVTRCIHNEILMYLRALKRLKSNIALDTVIGEDTTGNVLTIEDTIGTERFQTEETILTDEIIVNVFDAIKTLPEKEQELILSRYGFLGDESLTQGQLAKKFGVSQPHISRVEKRILEKIKQLLIQKGLDFSY